MKCSKQAILARFHKLPRLRFEDQQLTSFAGTIVFQLLFQRLDLKARLKPCFPANSSAIFGPHLIVMWLILHLLLGFRRLRDVDYYRDDPVVFRLLGVRRLPDVATVSRTLAKMGHSSVEKVRHLSSTLVVQALRRERCPRLTLDFDGSVSSTCGHAEGTAVGYNPKKKGARSYYNLFCTVAQTGQFFDVLHRPGNVHDSKDAHEFMMNVFDRVRDELAHPVLESRLDSAFFSQYTLTLMDLYGVECTISVPFERFALLKDKIEARQRWCYLDEQCSYFESDWKPKSWPASYRFSSCAAGYGARPRKRCNWICSNPEHSITSTALWLPTSRARHVACSSSTMAAALRKGSSPRRPGQLRVEVGVVFVGLGGGVRIRRRGDQADVRVVRAGLVCVLVRLDAPFFRGHFFPPLLGKWWGGCRHAGAAPASPSPCKFGEASG